IVSHVAANVIISGNEIRTVESAGISVFTTLGAVSVDGNVIVPGPARFADAPCCTGGNGILIGATGAGGVEVADNTVTVENPIAEGIALAGFGPEIQGASVSHNSVAMAGAFAGLSLEDDVRGAVVSHNTVTGSG